jgi:threonine dehydratase
MGLVIEPAGALGVAALLAGRERFAGGRVTTIACGGNVTDEQRRAWIC